MTASVAVLSYSPLHRDARVLRQIRVLAEHYDVTSIGYGPAPADVVDHIQIPDDIVYWHKDRRLLLARAYQRCYDAMPVQQWLRAHVTDRYDVIVANDVDPIPFAVAANPRAGVHVDLHEYSPSQREHLLWWRLLLSPYYSWILQRWATRAASATTVSPGLQRKFADRFGINARLVLNAPPLADLQPTPVATPLRLVHSGIGAPERLTTMLAGMELVRSGATLDLFLMDHGDGYVPSLRQRYAEGPVRVQDPVPTEDLVATLAGYDVGVYMQPPLTFNLAHALPNKLFDFVQARLGVVIGPSPDMAEIVKRHGLGAITPDFTAAGFAATIDALTAEQVAAFKSASHAAAPQLSSQQQVGGWLDAVAALLR